MSLLKVLVLFSVMIYEGATSDVESIGTVQSGSAALADSVNLQVIPSHTNTSSFTPSVIPDLIDSSTSTTPSTTTPSFDPFETTASSTSTSTTPSTPSTSTTTPTPSTISSTSPSTTTPSTTPTTPSSTTLSPTTPSTTLAPTTLPPVTPVPPHPVAASWTVVDENNITCLVIKLAASFDIPYKNLNGKTENATVVLPGNATANGTCTSFMEDLNKQAISLQWTADKEDNPNMLTLVFQRNESSGGSERTILKEQYFLSDILLQVYPDAVNFPNSSDASYIYGKLSNGNLFPVAVNNSYRCNSEETVQLDFDKNIGFVHLTNVQLEAFRSQTNDKFNTAMDCSADKIFTSDIVPIAVGCALAALVVIVLVAYLIGRRRARQRGYQSV